MPTYRFMNNTTNEEYEQFMSISALDVYLQENTHITQMVNGAPMIVTGVPRKPENGFRDLLKDIKKSNSRGISRSTINTF
jgi:hypothetical protein